MYNKTSNSRVIIENCLCLRTDEILIKIDFCSRCIHYISKECSSLTLYALNKSLLNKMKMNSIVRCPLLKKNNYTF